VPFPAPSQLAGMAVCSYFYEAMPEGTSVERLERFESQELLGRMGFPWISVGFRIQKEATFRYFQWVPACLIELYHIRSYIILIILN